MYILGNKHNQYVVIRISSGNPADLVVCLRIPPGNGFPIGTFFWMNCSVTKGSVKETMIILCARVVASSQGR